MTGEPPGGVTVMVPALRPVTLGVELPVTLWIRMHPPIETGAEPTEGIPETFWKIATAALTVPVPGAVAWEIFKRPFLTVLPELNVES